MKISVVIPIYNVEDYVKRCIESVIAQTYKGEIECILINDASLDKSMSVVNDIISQYKGNIDFKVIDHKENKGLSAARNTGIRNATGEYVFFLDSDDYILSNCLEILSTPLKDFKYNFVVSNCQLDIKDKSFYSIPLQSGGYNDKRFVFKSFCLHYWPSMAWNKLCNLEFIRKHNLYFLEGLIHEDELWSFQIAFAAVNMFVCSEITYIYCYRPNSIVNEQSTNLKHLRAYTKVLEQTSMYFNKENLFENAVIYNHMNNVLVMIFKLYFNRDIKQFYEFYKDIKYLFDKCPRKSLLKNSFLLKKSYPLKSFYLLFNPKIGKYILSIIKSII